MESIHLEIQVGRSNCSRWACNRFQGVVGGGPQSIGARTVGDRSHGPGNLKGEKEGPPLPVLNYRAL